MTLAADGLIVYANEAAERLLAVGSGSLVGGHLRERVHPDERPRFDALLERARLAPAHAEVRVRGKRGGRPLYLSLRPLEDRGDHLIAAVLADLTEQKATEAALESERLARSIFEQAGEPIIVCDRDGVVIRASRAAVRLVGREPLFQDFDAVLPLRTGDGRGDFSLVQHGHRRLRSKDVRLERADGASFSLILSLSPLKTADQGLIGSVVTLTDVTRLREAEKTREALLLDLEQANKELSTIESLSRAGLQLTTLDQLAHSIVSQVALAMNADEAALLLVRDGHVELAAAVPPIGGGRRRIEVGTGFVGAVLKMGRTVFIEHADSSRLITAGERARGHNSILGSPLLDGKDVLGALCVGWKETRAADVGQQRFLEIIAARAARSIQARMLADERDEERLTAEALAVELAEANVQLRARQEVLELLHELTTLANSSLSLVKIGGRVLELMHQRLDLKAATIYEVDAQADLLRLLALVGFPDEQAALMKTLPIDDASTTGRIVYRDLPLVTHESSLASPQSPARLRAAIGTDKTRWIVLPLKKAERILGVLGLSFMGERPFDEDELSLYGSIAELLSSAFANARARETEVDAQMKQAALEERSRLARDLHDSITQALFAAALKAEAMAQDEAAASGRAATAQELRRLTRGALAQMRTLLLELRSQALGDVPIEQLLRNVVEATEGRASINVELRLRGKVEPPRELHTALYRVTQEALNNVVRHSGAVNASVTLQVEPSRVLLQVHDDGCGFVPGPLSGSHFGLQSMRERAAEIGAELRLVSSPGEGTLVMLDWTGSEVDQIS